MSPNHPVSNPFGAGPSGPTAGSSDVQNPFQIVGGGVGQPSQPSPFEAAANQVPFGQPQGGGAQIPPPRQPAAPAAPANPFQVAPEQQAQPQQPYGGQAAQPQAGGGFEMKGFPPGPAPMNQLDAAPLGGGGDQGGEAAPPTADPFAGMDLPQVSENPGGESAAVAEPEEDVVDFSAPEGEAAAAPKEAKPEPAKEESPAPKKKSFEPVKPSASEAVTSQTKQLELRAIFGVDHELSHQEIMQRARGLPGILHVSKANVKEVAALETLQGCTSKLGLDEDEPIVLSCPGGFIDFLSAEDISLAILRKDKYAPGVRETLIICARELDKL